MRKITAFLAGVLVTASAAVAQVDAQLPEYKPSQGVFGSLKSVGSDTLNNLMTLWTQEFTKFYPSVKPEIEGKGSSTAPPALIEGQSQFGPMSREMKSSEIDKFEATFGYKPTVIRTAIDCLAVYVHKDCPLEEISIPQITKVFSVAGSDMTWGDLGVTDTAYANKPINLYGRNSASGTYAYFKEVGLAKNDFKASVKEQPGSSAVVQAVATDRFGMGYSGIGYKTADVKAVRVSLDDGEEAFPAEGDYAYSGDYPLARFLYIYMNYDARKALDPLRAEFVKLVFSKQGQEVVVKDGYIPVTADIAREDLENLGITPDF
ncbi:MAG: PstS family phosphate ABC transporter substrate-binding protein [Phycisphaerales bacterium]|nr:PstS family phosphate ABC transporter substrate-binding protein [Phycisphaerales bacterium]